MASNPITKLYWELSNVGLEKRANNIDLTLKNREK